MNFVATHSNSRTLLATYRFGDYSCQNGFIGQRCRLGNLRAHEALPGTPTLKPTTETKVKTPLTRLT